MAVAGRRLVVTGGTWTTGLESKKESATERERCLGRRRDQAERDLEGWASGTGADQVRKTGSRHGFVGGKVDGSGRGGSREHRWRSGFLVSAGWKRSGLSVMVVSQVFPGLCCPGLFISFWLQICVRSLETRDSRNKGWPNT